MSDYREFPNPVPAARAPSSTMPPTPPLPPAAVPISPPLPNPRHARRVPPHIDAEGTALIRRVAPQLGLG
jgi:hypothetical protein